MALRLVSILLVALSAMSMPACSRSREAAAATEESPHEEATVPTPVPSSPEPRVATAETGRPIVRTLLVDSHLIVERNVGVTSRRDGMIESIEADRGDHVREGQPLAVLEQKDLMLSERVAMLELEKESSSCARAERLHEQGIVTEEAVESARLRRDAAQNAIERIRYELSKCVLRAPFDGVVSGRFVEKGQFVRMDDRKTLFQVTALGPLLARVYVPEWALAGLKEGQAVRVSLEGPDRDPLPARVRWINDVVDAASGTVEVLAEVRSGPTDPPLRPGLSVHVEIPLSFGTGRDGGVILSLPREVLGADLEPGGEVAMKVLAADGTVQTRWVVLGLVGDDRVEVRRGLAAGDQVVRPE